MHKCKLLLVFLVAVLFTNHNYSQPRTDQFLNDILLKSENSILKDVLGHADRYRCQVIYTRIDRDRHNRPHFKNYYFNFDPLLYFNPASTVKMPLAFLALEKLHTMPVPGVDKYTSLQIDSAYPGQKTAYKDATSKNGFPSIAHYIRKAFLVSDNDAYNRMYQFIGQQNINRGLHAKGYPDVRITRQFMGFTYDQNRHTNPVRFIKDDGTVLFTQPAAYNTDSFDYSHLVKLGKGYLDRNDSLVNEPFDFTIHNNVSLWDLQQILQSVLFPASVPERRRFNLGSDDRAFLMRYLSQFPSETNYPKYDTTKYFDSYVKFFFRDTAHKMPGNVRVFNKVGWAYGFMTDVSYVADFSNKVEFMLSATLYVNNDEILNDNKYEYETTGYPFLYQLGQTIYQYELQRKRRYKTELSDFHIRYEQRDRTDTRPAIKDVDN
jgi:hypothetical protein